MSQGYSELRLSLLSLGWPQSGLNALALVFQIDLIWIVEVQGKRKSVTRVAVVESETESTTVQLDEVLGIGTIARHCRWPQISKPAHSSQSCHQTTFARVTRHKKSDGYGRKQKVYVHTPIYTCIRSIMRMHALPISWRFMFAMGYAQYPLASLALGRGRCAYTNGCLHETRTAICTTIVPSDNMTVASFRTC